MLDQNLVDCTASVVPNDDETRTLIFLEPVTVIEIECPECRFLAGRTVAC